MISHNLSLVLINYLAFWLLSFCTMVTMTRAVNNPLYSLVLDSPVQISMKILSTGELRQPDCQALTGFEIM